MGPIARATFRTSLVLGLRLIVQVATLLIVARLLGAENFGVFAAVAALALVLGTLSTFGSQLVLIREVSQESARHQRVLEFAIPTTILGGSLLLALYLACVPSYLGEAAPKMSVLLSLGVSELMLQPIISLTANLQLGLGHVARSQLLMVVPLLLRLMAAAIVWQLAPNEPLTVYAHGYFFASIVAMFIAIATLPQPRPRLGSLRLPALQDLKGMSGFAALGLSGAAPTELDKTLAAKLLPLDAAGVYAAGTRVIGAAVLPVTAMLLSALPRLFRESHAGTNITYRLRNWLLGASLSYGLLLALVLWSAAPLLENVFGAGFTGLVETVRWLCLAVPWFSLRIVSASILMAMGQAWWRVRIEIGGVILLMLSALLLVPRAGNVAMPLALALAECSMALFGICLVLGSRGIRRQKRTSSEI